jgi:predicted aldo/keto reductase-like oxidoreductase
MITQGAITVKDALSYAMSLPVATTLSGMNSLAILKQNLEVAVSFEKLSASQMAGIEQRRCRNRRRSPGTFQNYRQVRRKSRPAQHASPTAEELPV